MDDIVEVWFRGGRCFVNPMAFTTEGFRVSAPPFREVEAGVSALGAAVRAAATRCKTEIPHPKDWDSVLAPLYELAAARGEREFNRGAVRVEVAMSAASVRVARWIREGGGFSADSATPASELKVDCSDDALGAAVLDASGAEKT